MTKMSKRLLFWVWLLMAVTMSAEQWPSTLYMAHTSFSSTGRVEATGSDGVYDFNVTYSTSSTGAPKYFIFTSATSATNAKKGTYKIFGASSIESGVNIQPLEGVSYPLTDLSSADDATALASQNICAFLPIYNRNISVKAHVDLNAMTVIFTREPAYATPETLGIFNKDVSKPIASAVIDENGVARYSLTLTAAQYIYFSANAADRISTQDNMIWGSSTQTTPATTEVETGNTYSLERTTYYQVYSKSTCNFHLPSGSYDIIADMRNGTVEFAPYTGAYKPKPSTLKMLSYDFKSTYSSAEGVNGVYTFTFDRSANFTSEPYYAIFTDATSASAAAASGWCLGCSSGEVNFTPVYGREYALADLDPAKTSTDKVGCFAPVYPQKYIVTVDLNRKTVKFDTDGELDPLTVLNMFGSDMKQIGSSTADADGKHRFGYKGVSGTKVFFTTSTTKDGIKTNNALTYGAGGHAAPINIETEVDHSYDLLPMSYRRLVTDASGYFILPGNCDIEVDPASGAIAILPYSGSHQTLPATMYMRTNKFSLLGTSAGEEGVFTFDWDASGKFTSDPFYLIFTDAASLDKAKTSSWNLGSTVADTNICPAYGKEYPIVDIDPEKAYNSDQSTFMPLYPQHYIITLNLKENTVKFDPQDATDPLTTLNMFDGNLKPSGSAIAEEDGKFHFTYRGSGGEMVCFSTAGAATDIKTVNALTFGAGGHANPIILEAEYSTPYSFEPMSYRRLYTDKTGFYMLPGKCDIEVDPAKGTVTFLPYSGIYSPMPEKLYMKPNTLPSSIYGEAEGQDGIYTFEYTTQGYSSAPRNIVFTDATSAAAATMASWILGASEDGSIVEPAPGIVTPLYDVSATAVKDNEQSYFTPFYPYTYTITVNLNDYTVTWGKPIDTPAALYLADDTMRIHGEASAGLEDVYEFETVTYGSHPVFFTDAKNSSELYKTPWIFMATPYCELDNVAISGSASEDLYRGLAYSYAYKKKGFWMTPEGCNKVTAKVDVKNNTIEWSATPKVHRTPEVLYLLDYIFQPLAQCVGNNDGIFDFDVTLAEEEYISFTDSMEDDADPDRVFYGSCLPYKASPVDVADGSELPIVITSEAIIKKRTATYIVPAGRWKIHLDLNAGQISFTDITRGGQWVIPQSISLCDDELNVLGGPVDGEDGVFNFNGVSISPDKDLTKVVLRNNAVSGELFGSNANGEMGVTVENRKAYPLYMPTAQWVTVDGASCFGLEPGTYDITADFHKKTVTFTDPSIPVYPDKMQLITLTDDGEPAVLSTATGAKGQYTFSMRNDAATSVTFKAQTEGTQYGASDAKEIASHTPVSVVESEAPVAFDIPEGLWTLKLNLPEMTLVGIETQRPVLTETSMPSGSAFPSYFGVGTEPIVTFTFNNNIKSVESVSVVLGEYNGGLPAEGELTSVYTVVPKIVDNRITIDLSSKKYELPEGAEAKAYIVLKKIIDTNNEALVSEPSEGMPHGSLIFEYPLVDFERINIHGIFEIEHGSNIDEVANINLRLSHFKHISHSGFVFYLENDETPYPAKWTAGETDAEGYTAVSVSVPMAIRGAGNLILKIDGLDIDDGYDDHADDVMHLVVSEQNPTLYVTSDPQAGKPVGAIEQIKLTWTHSLISSVGNMAESATLTLVQPENNPSQAPRNMQKADNDATQTALSYSYPEDERALILTPSEPVAVTGTYRLDLHEGDLVFNDDPEATNKPISILMNVDTMLGISTVLITDDTDVTVTDLNGCTVRKGQGAETIRGLKGIYIVNGVKCILN